MGEECAVGSGGGREEENDPSSSKNKKTLTMDMYRDVSGCNTYNYGDTLYWDARYIREAGSFDWYQRYSALRPFVRNYIPTSSRVLMVGCGNAGFCFVVMSEDMVKDGYEDIVNIDISSVVIEMMRKKYESLSQLKYMQMDARDMSFFKDETFDSVIDKGTLDSLMVRLSTWDAVMMSPVSVLARPNFVIMLLDSSAAPMLQLALAKCWEKLLKPGGIYMLITYGDPTVRIPHLNRPAYNWKIILYIIPRPGFQRSEDCSSSKSYLEPVPIMENGLLPPDFLLEDPDSHYIYVCKKMDGLTGHPTETIQ